jgi:hypothetical protein
MMLRWISEVPPAMVPEMGSTVSDTGVQSMVMVTGGKRDV